MRRLHRLCAVALLIAAYSLSFSTTVHADTGGSCGPQELPYYSGKLVLPLDTYNVYVKLGALGQSAAVSAFAQVADDAACTSIGSNNASGNEWHQVGTYHQSVDGSEATFQLSSDALTNSPNANRPSVMLVSQTNPVCIPSIECVASIAGHNAYIRPAGTNLDSAALHIVRVSSVDLTHAIKVQYYADNEMLYETKTLQEFKNEAIPYYASKLIRVVYYDSGQTAVIETSPPENITFSPWAVLQIFAGKYRNTLIVIGAFLSLVIVIRLVTLLRGYIERRRRWDVAHGFKKDEVDLAITNEQRHRLRIKNTIRTVWGYLERIIVTVGIVAGIVFVLNAFLIQIGTVSGSSMWSTLEDGQKIVINKAPVTFAQMNKSQYVPERGAIVVVSPNFGTVDSSAQEDADSLIIKRVVGLPGERIVADGGSLTVYNKAHPEGFNPDAASRWLTHVQADESTDHIDVTLGENEIFICGDNRPISIDSRFNGPISTNQILGVVSWY